MTWHEAMERYGADKPDVRFGMELVELTEVFAGTEFKAFQAPTRSRASACPGGGDIDAQQARRAHRPGQALGAKGLVWMRVGDGGALESPVAKFLSEAEQVGAASTRSARAPATCCCIVADEWMTTCEVLGQLRIDLGRPPVHEGPYRYVWVVDFPLFVGVDEDGPPDPGAPPVHPPAPRRHRPARDRPDVGAQPGLRPRAQRLGARLGQRSGSTSPTCSSAIFELLGIDDGGGAARGSASSSTPFRYGAPPHAGFAFGIDRLVAILAGEENIREVIAFPKTQSGADPMTGAPTPVDPKQLADLGLRPLPPSS